MSGNALQTESSLSWKKEINRRVAEHKSRKVASAEAELAQPEVTQNANRRAAEAAARVAARYANAPSYSEVLASEARAVVRAAEAATRAAQEAQIAAESMLAGISAVAELEPQPDSQAFEIRWEPEPPSALSQPSAASASRGAEALRTGRRGLRIDESKNFPFADEGDAEGPEMVEPALPIHANLIEFPRELVATRKMRPRLAEAPFGSPDTGTQLSIFEVEPSSVSTTPAPAEAVESANSDQQATHWLEETAIPLSEPRWPAIELEPHEDHGAKEMQAIQATLAPEAKLEPAPAADAQQTHAIERAPMHRRLLATLVDSALIAAASLSTVALGLSRSAELPGIRTVELGAAAGFILIAFLYEALFLTVSGATPGMKYAHLRLRTFDGRTPGCGQRIQRFMSLLLSVLPAGLGILWSIFDKDHMSWHDRLSHTYPQQTYGSSV